MSYQYGYNSQPAFVQPQNQHVYGAQAFQGQQPPAHQQQFYPSPYARIQPQQRPPPQYAGQTGMATSMGGASNGAGGGRGMMPVARTPQHQPQNQQSYILSKWTAIGQICDASDRPAGCLGPPALMSLLLLYRSPKSIQYCGLSPINSYKTIHTGPTVIPTSISANLTATTSIPNYQRTCATTTNDHPDAVPRPYSVSSSNTVAVTAATISDPVS